MVNAIIQYKGKTVITELPRVYLDICQELLSVGCSKPLERISLMDNEEDDIRVKLYFENDIGKLLRDIKEMIEQVGQEKISFFCPIEGNLDNQEYGGVAPVGNWFLKSYAWDIRELLEMEKNFPEDTLAQYYDGDEFIKAKLVSVIWKVEEYKSRLYGRIDCRFKEELTEEKTEKFKEWLRGQCSDSFGEHFEQQPIHTKEGDLFVSFWNNSNSYFLCIEDELDDCIEKRRKCR